MLSNLCVAILLTTLLKYCESVETSCEQSEKLFADLCFTPFPAIDYDTETYKDLQPAGGWHIQFGNDVARLHLAELVKGKLLTHDEVTDDFCPRIKIEHGDNAHHSDGQYFGFGDLYANFTCEGSKDLPGVLRCNVENSRGTMYAEKLNTYISYFSFEGFFVFISCFQNGEVGWYTGSLSNQLTAEQNQIVESHVEELGFPQNTSTNLYKDSCDAGMSEAQKLFENYLNSAPFLKFI